MTQEYLYFWLSSEPIMNAMASAGTGAAIPGLNRGGFTSLPFDVPPVSVRDKVNAVLEPLVTSCLTLAAENVTLRSTRDQLLPLLISGAVRVRAA